MSELVNILVEGDREPLGFIEITSETTLEDARKAIEGEIENLPNSFRFLFLNKDILVKVSLRQESKTKAIKATTKSCLVLRPVVESTNPDAKEESSISLDKYLNKAQQTIDTSKVNVVIDSDHTQAVRKFWHEMDHHIKENALLKSPRGERRKKLHRSASNLSEDCDSDDSAASSHSTPDTTPQKALLAVDSISFSSREDDHQPRPMIPLSSIPSLQEIEPHKSDMAEPTVQAPKSRSASVESPKPESQQKDTPASEPPKLKKDSSAESDTTIMEDSPSPLSLSPNSSYGSAADALTDDGLLRSSALLRSRMSKSRSTILKLEGFIQNRPSVQLLAEKRILDESTISDLSSTPSSPNHSMSFSELMIKSPLIKPDLTWRVELAAGKSAGGITTLEFLDKYEYYYKECFSTEPHSNFVGEHTKNGPMVVSIMDESPYQNGPPFIYPAIIRSEKYDDRVFLDLSKKPKNKSDLIRALKTSFPHLLSTTKFTRNESPALIADLIKYEQDQIIKNMKVGVLYCAEGQTTDDEMFNNNTITESFQEFLDFLGDKVELQGFKGYTGGLDVKTNTTGTHSIYTKFLGLEIMFHVSSMLPFFPNDPQQVERKRHLGNDIVVIVFKQGKTPFEPSVIKSQFNHVFVVISPADPDDIPADARSHTHYQVAICSKRDVPPFGPPIQASSLFKKDIHFRDFLLTKLLNAERASMVAPIFSRKMEFARKQLLNHMCTNSYEVAEENNNNSDPELENTLIYHGVATQGVQQVTVSVKGHDFNFKSGVDPNTPISQFIEKLEKRVPITQHGYGLYFDGELMDKDSTWMKYKYNFSKMKVEFYPFISPGEPKQIKHLDNDDLRMRRRFLTFSKKSDSFKTLRNPETDPTYVQKANPLYQSNESLDEALPLGSRPKSKTVSGPSSLPSSLTSSPTNSPSKSGRAVLRVGSDTVTGGGVVPVLVRSPTVEISIKVQSSSTVANLLEKIHMKFPDNPNWKLTCEGKTLNPVDLVESLPRSGYEPVTVDFGPEEKTRVKLRKSFLH